MYAAPPPLSYFIRTVRNLLYISDFRPKPSDEKSEAFGQRVRSLRTECPKPSDFFGQQYLDCYG